VSEVLDESIGGVETDYIDAIERAGRLLARGPKTEHQLRQRLDAEGIDADVVDRVLSRLGELGLVDDLAFACRWIEERSTRVGRGADALVAELTAKGVDREAIERALASFDEVALARSWAVRLLSRVEHRPLNEQGIRLRAMLLRRGFSDEAATEGARAVLPPEGWD
jgi:regulatory protein